MLAVSISAQLCYHLPNMLGWHLIGRYPDEEDGVGAWLLHHNGEALLLEMPPDLTAKDVSTALTNVHAKLVFATASHRHGDHLDMDVWRALRRAFPNTWFQLPSCGSPTDRCLRLAGEPLWQIHAPKHSKTDMATVFRGVAHTGDIELGQLESVNDDVPEIVKKLSMKHLEQFCQRDNHYVHTVLSAHLNSLRHLHSDEDWANLFRFEGCLT